MSAASPPWPPSIWSAAACRTGLPACLRRCRHAPLPHIHRHGVALTIDYIIHGRLHRRAVWKRAGTTLTGPSFAVPLRQVQRPAGVRLEIRDRAIRPGDAAHDTMHVRAAHVGRHQLAVAHRADFDDGLQHRLRRVAVHPIRSVQHAFPSGTLQGGGGFVEATPVIASGTVHPPARVARKVGAVTAKSEKVGQRRAVRSGGEISQRNPTCLEPGPSRPAGIPALTGRGCTPSTYGRPNAL